MNLEIESFGRAKVLRVKEDRLSYPLLTDFFEKSYALIESGARELIINLSEVRSVDSPSLGCLMDISRNLSRHDGKLVLVGLTDRVASLATLVGLTRNLETYAEEEDALAPFPCRRAS